MTNPFKPKGMPTLVPYLTVRNADESVAYYRDVFQFILMHTPEKQNNHIIHAEMSLGDAVVMMAPEGAWGSTKKAPITTGQAPSIALYLYVKDVDAHFKHAKDKGAKVISAPENMFWGDRCCVLQDIDGYEWTFSTNVGEHDLSHIPKA